MRERGAHFLRRVGGKVKRHDFQEKFFAWREEQQQRGLACIPRRGIGTQAIQGASTALSTVLYSMLQKGPYSSVCWPYSKRVAQKSRLLSNSSLAQFSMHFVECILFCTIQQLLARVSRQIGDCLWLFANSTGPYRSYSQGSFLKIQFGTVF
jgi:hypothetical protein